MADEQKVAVLAMNPPGRTSDDGLVTAQDAKMRKELNAYAVMAYVAVSDRNAMAEQLKGLTHFTQAFNELQEKLAAAEAKAEDLQLEVWRNEAFVTRSRIQLRVKDSEIAGLRKDMKKGENFSERKSAESDESVETSKAAGSDSVDGGTEDKEEKKEEGANADMEKPKSPQPGKSDYLMSRGLQIGVSREIHEAVIQENLHLKGHLKQLLVDQGGSLKDLMDTIQYKEIIKQQRRKIDEKEEEIAKIKATLEQANNPKEQTAKTLFDMEGKVKNSERTIKMKQVMIEALSTRIEELSKALEKLQQRDEIQIAHMRSAFSDGSRSAVTADSPVDQVLPSIQIKSLTKENSRLMKLQKHQETENESLRQERDKALAEKTENQRQLATLSQMKFQPCSTCKDLKAAKEHAEEELNVTKGELSAAFIQVDTYKSDFKERCAEMEKTKSSLRNELETWKRNCQMLNRQMESMRRELDEQMSNNGKLQAENRYFTQALAGQRRNDPAMYPASMPPMAAEQCGAMVNNPWQESSGYASRKSEVVVGRDQCDLPSPQDEATSPHSHQYSTARPGSSSNRRRQNKLNCMKCGCEFPIERVQDYEDHQRHCGQSRLTCLRCRLEFSPDRQHDYEDHQRSCTGHS